MKRPPLHTIVVEPWEAQPFGIRVTIEAVAMTLWPMTHAARLTVLITLIACEIAEVAENEDQVDALIDILRRQMKTVVTPEIRH